MSETRSLKVIADEIYSLQGTKLGLSGSALLYAAPYLEAMSQLDKITDSYYLNSADSIVRYFLSNVSTWRGDAARRIKAELKAML